MSNLTQHPSALSSPATNESAEDFSIILSSSHIIPSNAASEASEASELENEEFRPITPIVKLIASLRLPHDRSEKELAELAPMIKIDLDDNIIDSVTDLFNILFPDSVLPFGVTEQLLMSLPKRIYNSTDYKWNLTNANTESVSKVFTTEHLDCRN
jgi:hypothetical protein